MDTTARLVAETDAVTPSRSRVINYTMHIHNERKFDSYFPILIKLTLTKKSSAAKNSATHLQKLLK